MRLLIFLFSIGLFAQHTYFGPTHPVPDESRLVRVQILIQDSPESGGLQIVSAEFDGQNIPLKPRGINGQRGSASFQVRPGKYKLKWVVNRSTYAWPRKVSHEEEVEINSRDLWVQISIVGEEATIL